MSRTWSTVEAERPALPSASFDLPARIGIIDPGYTPIVALAVLLANITRHSARPSAGNHPVITAEPLGLKESLHTRARCLPRRGRRIR